MTRTDMQRYLVTIPRDALRSFCSHKLYECFGGRLSGTFLLIEAIRADGEDKIKMLIKAQTVNETLPEPIVVEPVLGIEPFTGNGDV